MGSHSVEKLTNGDPLIREISSKNQSYNVQPPYNGMIVITRYSVNTFSCSK